jgi:hypothetical protein
MLLFFLKQAGGKIFFVLCHFILHPTVFGMQNLEKFPKNISSIRILATFPGF